MWTQKVRVIVPPKVSAPRGADWAALAALYGTSAADAEDISGWDIHDDQTNREGHVAGSGCGGSDDIADHELEGFLRFPDQIRQDRYADRDAGGRGGDGDATQADRRIVEARPSGRVEGGAMEGDRSGRRSVQADFEARPQILLHTLRT